MKKFLLLISVCFCITPLLSQVASADNHERESFYLSTTELSVKLGHTQAFMDGVKAVRECYKNAGDDTPWWIWSRIQGPGSVFVVTGNYENWQEFFADDATDESCRGVVQERVLPHLDSTDHQIASYMPDWSSDQPSAASFVVVYYFTVSDFELFEKTVAAIEKGIKGDGGQSADWYYKMGGRDSSHFFVVEPYADAAALDAEDPGVWKRLETAVGKKKAEKLQADFRASVSEWWSYMYALHQDLSYMPESSE
ncbi:hypothetical protein [Pseudidiomarina terrestris]|uniref:hypothetical protein n=1 Tax=Pseudidiomarina terrestris TaxID=2820060 RepID=UPI0026549D22|nr:MULTISPECIES: hypothetical protein [unclassified Pseudidiomarina]MDN7127508.1 hypothetical protein [Pseudidiomarina sp. 1APR75-33.1]MDN7136008.1 hypothetical protein [Pseudidiomarina sp. 1ASP75-5]MDN7138459.1 hypothetical protein [Pseudidiomarina sp. 1ASP75-14]MEA3589045.1 hypothetical protein [Pseudidiomarina sp. 1APP75-27a]